MIDTNFISRYGDAIVNIFAVGSRHKALYACLLNQQVEAVTGLLTLGVQINKLYKDGDTPLSVALRCYAPKSHKEHSCILLLLQHGADTNQEYQTTLPLNNKIVSRKPLDDSIHCKWHSYIRLLCIYGANDDNIQYRADNYEAEKNLVDYWSEQKKSLDKYIVIANNYLTAGNYSNALLYWQKAGDIWLRLAGEEALDKNFSEVFLNHYYHQAKLYYEKAEACLKTITDLNFIEKNRDNLGQLFNTLAETCNSLKQSNEAREYASKAAKYYYTSPTSLQRNKPHLLPEDSAETILADADSAPLLPSTRKTLQ